MLKDQQNWEISIQTDKREKGKDTNYHYEEWEKWGDIATYYTDILKIIKIAWQTLCQKDNFDEIHAFLEGQKLPKATEIEKENWNNPTFTK